MERVVDRSELLSEASTPPSSPDLSKITTLGQFEFVHRKQDSNTDNTRQEDGYEDKDELEFQLFAPSARKSDDPPAVAKIRIATPEASEHESGFIRPNRNDSYYFKGPVTTAERQNYETAALSGQDILLASQTPWPGMAYPWKLLEIPSSRKQRILLEGSDAIYERLLGHHAVVASKHTRPGKKSRIKLRMKAAAAKAKQEQALKAAASKEAAEQEKRTRRNREKKVKKKNREKAKKAEAALAAPTGDDAEMAGDKPDLDTD
ncbi:uncharacterized protein MYCFIDRAFT_82579 [Pseudocercospora fijiensis CIRAD86]|uniref:Uncharacterized protein n=1 Tax=Pseudocercospora fijiensis (strain CIRAD86) TaxID=383855 RepID=M2Z7C1_PSEFD|nr:uncharacterized protein MYCFIDRAFT_82579 [Pseudocercospora fijiensis CIRAD86]EME85680.1 hypothetical protein MYCFIDRAFT_82579 [Pseudocercospora fijiensis CIRAD86]